MNYTEKELDLARKYANGEFNDVQLNYIISTNNLNKKNVLFLTEFCRISAPFFAFCWVVFLFYVFHLVLCFAYSFISF